MAPTERHPSAAGAVSEPSTPALPSSPLWKSKAPSPFALQLELSNHSNQHHQLIHARSYHDGLMRKRSTSDSTAAVAMVFGGSSALRRFSKVSIDGRHNSDSDSPAFLALAKSNVPSNAKKSPHHNSGKKMRLGRGAKSSKLGSHHAHGKKEYKKPDGNEIHVKHEQYALTYGMMSGILNSAGMQNPFKRRLTMDDFMRVDKRNFPANSKLQHPFKFKDYSPDIFRQIRRRFCIDTADYMVTLCGDFNYIEFMSNSKSGQFFFYSHDGRFMIKTQTKEESKFLRRILPHYYKFVMENPNTLITRFYGMHRVKMHHLRRKVHFIIMASVFDTPLEIHARFDLKGSRVGRRASPEEKAHNGVLKDMDLLESNFRLQMGAERRAMLLVQIRKDVEFLKRMKVMDYSLLIGVHDSRQVVKCDPVNAGDSIKATSSVQATLPEEVSAAETTMTEISVSPSPGPATSMSQGGNGGVQGQRVAFSSSPSSRGLRSLSLPEEPSKNSSSPRGGGSVGGFPMRISEGTAPTSVLDSDSDSDSDELMESDNSPLNGSSNGNALFEGDLGVNPLSPNSLQMDRFPGQSESLFGKDQGGIYGRDRNGRKNGFVYFLGLIDILQQYNTKKIAETIIKGFRHNRKQISSVNPVFYGDRFVEFMEKHVILDETLPPMLQELSLVATVEDDDGQR